MINLKHYIIINMPYELTHFLLENKCYSQFIANMLDFQKKWNFTKEQTVSCFKCKAPMAYAFHWRDTPEGFWYWDHLNKKQILS